MTNSVTKLSVVPQIGSGRQVQYLARVQDLADLVALLLDGRKLVGRPIVAAKDARNSLLEVLAVLGEGNGRGRPCFLPIPWRLVWALLKSAETVGLKRGIRSDSVISLIHQDPNPDFKSARAAEASFRLFIAPPAP